MRRLLIFTLFSILISSFALAGEVERRIIVLEGKPLGLFSPALMILGEENLTKKFDDFSASLSSIISEAKILYDSRTRFALHSVVVELPKDKIRMLDFVEGILFHETDREVKITVIDKPEVTTGLVSPLLSESVEHIGAKVLHQWGIRGEGMRIAIVDTGIDWTHQDLGEGIGEGFKVEKAINAAFPNAPGMDDNGHGTHVSGIAAGVHGVAPDAKLWGIKVLNKDGVGFVSWILMGVDRAVDFDNDSSTFDRADMMNLSLGGDDGDPYDSMSLALNDAMISGVVVAVAAGNSGPNFKTVATPGTSLDAITVGATNLLDEVTSFSSVGPVIQNSSVKPDLVAPGYKINSSIPGNGHARWSGTSMATPHVVGAAALVKQLLKLQGEEEVSSFKVKSILLLSSIDLNLNMFKQGYGRLKLDALESVPVVIDKPTFTLGIWHGGKKGPSFRTGKNLSIQNISERRVRVKILASDGGDWSKGASLYASPLEVDLEQGESKEVELEFNANSKMGSTGTVGAFRLPIKFEVDDLWTGVIPACLVH